MRLLTVGAEPKQKIRVPLGDDVVIIDLIFRPMVQSWFIDVTFRDVVICQGRRLVLGVLMLEDLQKPFDLIIYDSSKLDLDPFSLTDFTGRCKLYVLEREDLISLRGFDVV